MKYCYVAYGHSSQCSKASKEIKEIGLEPNKESDLFIDDMIVHLENLK